jgi:DNA-binding PadR family transcriptional regulator
MLGLLLQKPAHGYDLHRRLQAEFRGIWRISLSQTYNILKRLEAQGDLAGERQAGESVHPRRIHRVTPAGEARFRRWLERPTPPSVRAIRVAFLTRLYFALADDRRQATRLVEDQREHLLADVERLHKAAALLSEDSRFAQLAFGLRIRQLQATLEWMRETRQVLGI